MAEPSTLAAVGSVADIVSTGLSISEAMSADAGFSCNSLTIRFKLPEGKKQPKPVTAATPADKKTAKPSSAHEQPTSSGGEPKLLSPGPTILNISRKAPTRGGYDPNSDISLGLRVVKWDNMLVCTLNLITLKGWNTRLGDQIRIEFTAPDSIGATNILSIFGFVNPFGPGFARFYGSLSIEATDTKVITKPVGELHIVTNLPKAFEHRSEDEGFRLIIV